MTHNFIEPCGSVRDTPDTVQDLYSPGNGYQTFCSDLLLISHRGFTY